MKQVLVLLAVLSSSGVFGQQKYQFTLAKTGYLSGSMGMGLGAHLNVSREISQPFSVGVSVDVVRFQQEGYWEAPLAVSFQMKAAKPMFLRLEPGYLLSNKEERTAWGTGFQKQGCFYVFGGMGYQFPVTCKFAPVVSFGATRFQHALTTFVPLPTDGTYPVKSYPGFFSFCARVGVTLL